MVARRFHSTLLLAGAIAVGAASAAAQDPGTATVTGQVRDVATSTPVAGATIVVSELRRSVTTDSLGEFRLEGVPSGPTRWTVVALGYVSLNESMTIEDGDHFTVGIMPRPVPVAGVTVTAQSVERFFEARLTRAGSPVTLIRGDELRLTGAPNVEQLVISRAKIRPCTLAETGGWRIVTTVVIAEMMCVWQRGRYVPTLGVNIDGRPAMGGFQEIAALQPSEIYAIEISDGGRRIHVFTAHFAARLARGREHIPAPSPVN